MKKIFIAFLFLCFMAQFARSQTYHPLVQEGKLWTTYHLYVYPNPPTSDYTKFEGDTTIGAFTYKKVWVATDTAMTQWQYYGIIREDAQKRVHYSWTDPSFEFLLYDFGAAVGDTLYLHGSLTYVLDSIGTYTLVSGEQRKSFMLHFTGYNCTDKWVEGIGSVTYGIMNSGNCGLLGDNPKMICGWENDTIKYHWDQYPDCFIFTGINDLSQNGQDIRVFPNPAKDKITITFSNQLLHDFNVVILSTAGEVLMNEPFQNQNQAMLSLNRMAKGLYLVKVQTSDKIRLEKLVIE